MAPRCQHSRTIHPPLLLQLRGIVERPLLLLLIRSSSLALLRRLILSRHHLTAAIVCQTNGLGEPLLNHAMLAAATSPSVSVHHLIVGQKNARLDTPTPISLLSVVHALLGLAHLVVDATAAAARVLWSGRHVGVDRLDHVLLILRLLWRWLLLHEHHWLVGGISAAGVAALRSGSIVSHTF